MKTYRLAFIIGACLVGIGLMGSSNAHGVDPEILTHGLEDADLAYYSGDDGAGGLAHVEYWTIDPAGLSGRELEKAGKIQSNQLHSSLFQPYQIVAGYEVTGILERTGRRQWVTFKLPDDWNGCLAVCGTPGLRNEYASEAVLVPWLLDAGYAVISGDKGLEYGWMSMLSGAHPSQHWGKMMHDMARRAKLRILLTTGRRVRRVYAVGLSNGGYQVRRALEIDARWPRWYRMFDGGLDWSGTYFASRSVLDSNRDGQVSIQEYAAARSLISHMDAAALTMGWAYSTGTLTTPEQYAQSPRYPSARTTMTAAGFTAESDIFWGLYNTNFDDFRHSPGLEAWKGVGYQNLVSYAYRAVKAYGHPELYRQYIIQNGPHVDAHADGQADFDFDGIKGNENAADELTPMQPYAQRAFQYLIDWVENGRRPPESKTVATDPTEDAEDPSELSW